MIFIYFLIIHADVHTHINIIANTQQTRIYIHTHMPKNFRLCLQFNLLKLDGREFIDIFSIISL